jgi:hypothetical protein
MYMSCVFYFGNEIVISFMIFYLPLIRMKAAIPGRMCHALMSNAAAIFFDSPLLILFAAALLLV